MLTHPEMLTQEFGHPGTGDIVDGGAGSDARMKVVNPLTSTGPSIGAWVVNESANTLLVRFPRVVFVGALVQVRTRGKIVFGEARSCTFKGSEYEIDIEKKEIY
jgi:hypothetical protein